MTTVYKYQRNIHMCTISRWFCSTFFVSKLCQKTHLKM